MSPKTRGSSRRSPKKVSRPSWTRSTDKRPLSERVQALKDKKAARRKEVDDKVAASKAREKTDPKYKAEMDKKREYNKKNPPITRGGPAPLPKGWTKDDMKKGKESDSTKAYKKFLLDRGNKKKVAKQKKVSTGPGKTGTRPTEAQIKSPAKKKRVSNGSRPYGTRPTEAEMKAGKRKTTGAKKKTIAERRAEGSKKLRNIAKKPPNRSKFTGAKKKTVAERRAEGTTNPRKIAKKPPNRSKFAGAKKKPTGIHPDAPKGANARWGKPRPMDGRSTTYVRPGGGRTGTPGGGRPNPRRGRS